MASRMSKRFTGLLSRTKSTGPSSDNEYDHANAPLGSPQANITPTIKRFCEFGSASNGGEEVLHLPVIVEAAESSPAAAAAAAHQIRKFLSRDYASKPNVQYNAVMLLRILSDNPGASFTRNFDRAFVSTVKECLRMCKDGGTQQILRETLDGLEANMPAQEGMEALITMWRKEKGSRASFAHADPLAQEFAGRNRGIFLDIPDAGARSYSASSRRRLPEPQELASRIEESRNTAKILLQLIQSTPADEVLNNDLLREFSDRCGGAQKSMAGYIACDNPAPDDETMLTLIETNEQLSLALSRYQRSLLTARKAYGLSHSPNAEAMQNSAVAAPVMTAAATATPAGNERSLLVPRNVSPPRSGSDASAFAANTDSETYRAPVGPPPPRQTNQFSPVTSASPPPLSSYPITLSNPPNPSSPSRRETNESSFSSSRAPRGAAYASPNGTSVSSSTAIGATAAAAGVAGVAGVAGAEYSSPPSPPTAMLARLNSREKYPSPRQLSPQSSQPAPQPQYQPQPMSPSERARITTPPRTPPQAQKQIDPFADPEDHETNPANNETTYSPPRTNWSPIVTTQQRQASYDDEDEDDAYGVSPVQTRTSPLLPSPGVGNGEGEAAMDSQRRWQDLRSSAQRSAGVVEIDGFSRVGRDE